MFILFAADSEAFFSSHWPFVVGVGLVFLSVQLIVCARFFHQIRNYEQTLLQLNRDFATGGDGRTHPERSSRNFPWLTWVNLNFPVGTTTPGNFTRDEVLQELDSRVAGSGDYLLLQRMGVAAPLLGVLLTVLGFIWVNPPEDQEISIGQMFQQVYPLVAGVGTGAALAFINQGLLHLAGWKAEHLRVIARTWFDTVIWSSVGLDTQAATVKAIAAMDRMSATLAAAADKQLKNAARLDKSAAAMQAATANFQEMVQTMGSEMHGLPETLAGLQRATAASAEALDKLLPMSRRAVAGLDVSVAAFRSAVEQDFVEAARKHHSSIESLTEAVTATTTGSHQMLSTAAEQFQDSARAINDAANSLTHRMNEQGNLSAEIVATQHSLRDAVAQLTETSHQFRHTLDSTVGPTQHQLSTATSSFAASAERLSTFIQQGLDPATARLTELHTTLGELQNTVRKIQEFNGAGTEISQLSESLKQASSAAETMVELPGQLREVMAAYAAEQADGNSNRGLLSGLFRSKPSNHTVAPQQEIGPSAEG